MRAVVVYDVCAVTRAVVVYDLCALMRLVVVVYAVCAVTRALVPDAVSHMCDNLLENSQSEKTVLEQLSA